MYQVAAIVLITLFAAACAAGDAEDGAGTTTTPTDQVTTTSTGATTSTTSATTDPVILEAFEAGGVGGSGQTVSPIGLVEGQTYLFGELVPGFTAVPPTPNWAVGIHNEASALLEWTGDNGQRPGSLYVMIFDGSDGSVDEGWARLESTITDSLGGLGTDLEWIDRGSGPVGPVTADWRELRTPVEMTRPGGWPCVISLPGGCVWTDATARFYVVPLGTFTATIAVYENRCDCEVGPSYSKFARGANELHDWTELFEELLRSVEFDT